MNILECICAELADGTARAPKSEEYTQLIQSFSINADSFNCTLSKLQNHMVMELEAQRNLIAAMDEDIMFCSGFRSGALLMLELLRPEQPSIS